MQLKIYRVRSVIESFNIDDSAVLNQRLFGENYITINYEARNVIDLAVGDYVVHNGIKYYLNTLPDIQKESTNHYTYSMVFESEYYNLAKVQFMFSGESEFDLIEDLEGFIDLMVTNLNRVDGAGTWVTDTLDQTNKEYKLLHFNNENCRQVVQRLCQEFDGEMFFDKNQINFMDSLGRASGVTLEYASGLRGISRKTISAKNICTRLYAFGSDKNIAPDYGTARLGMPDTKNFVTDGDFEVGNLNANWDEWGTPASRWLNNTNPGSIDDAGTYSYYHKSGIDSPENSGSYQNSITVLANTQYTLSAWVWLTSTYDGYDGIRVMTYDESTYHKAVVNEGTKRKWQKVSKTFTTGGSQTSLTIWVGGKGEAHFDHIQLERGANDTAFVNGTVNYLENNEEQYGTIEHTESFDAFPHRNGTINAVDGSDETIFYDTSIDFNLNDYLLTGVAPKIHFQTGNLAGYAFDIHKYVLSTDKITIVKIELQDGNTLPDDTVKPAATDEYTIIDIKMPPTYVTAAEEVLFTLAEAWLADNSAPRVEYELVSDPRYFKTNGILLNVGDEVTIIDTDLGVNKAVRVIELTRKLADQYDYSLKLSESTEGSISQRLYDDAEKLKNQSAINKAEDIVRARRSWRDGEELKNKVFDPDGLYYTEKIKPLSIETTLLAVGAKSQQFVLKEVEFKPNYGGDEDAITITAGTLVHLAVDNDDHDTIGTWTINENTTFQAGGLTTATAYYLYARCHKTNYSHANNTILLSSTAYTVDQGDYWYFLVGVLHSTTAGVARGISLTYGQTLINGKFITTGKIQSANGLTYFDLDGNTLVIGSASGYLNISDAPTDLSELDASQNTKLTGIQTNATAGARWGTNVANVPIRLTEDDTPTADGVYITPSFIGFWDQGEGEWTIRIKNNSGAGEFFVGSATQFMSFASGVLTVRGLLTAQDIQAGGTITGNTFQTAAPGAQRMVMDTDNTFRFYDAGGDLNVLIDDNLGGSGLGGIWCDDTRDGFDGELQLQGNTIRLTGASNAGVYVESGMMANPILSVKGLLDADTYPQGLYGGYNDVGGLVFIVSNNGIVNCTGSYQVDGTKVVGAQGASVSAPVGQANDLDSEARTAINAIRDRLQAHGLIS